MKNFLLGFLIGSGAILPGISSGAFCMAFGLYEPLLYSVLNFFKDVKKHFKFLFPICMGAFAGIFVFGNFLEFLFNKYYIQCCYAFIGLILGTIPVLYKNCNFKANKFVCLLMFLFSFVFGIYLTVLENNLSVTENSYSNSFLILAGVIMSAGIVVPGISKTVILMLLGIYPAYLSAIANLDFSFLFPILIGLAIGGLLFMLLLQFLFKHFKNYTYAAILGFVLSSVLILFPGFEFALSYIIGVILFILCLVVALII